MAEVTKFKNEKETELALCILNEVDEAREVFRIGRQLVGIMPIKGFDQLRKLGAIEFRGYKYGMAQFADLIPKTVFPIEDAQKLVLLLQQAVRIAPPPSAEDMEDDEMSARLLRRMSIGMTSGGRIGPPSPGVGIGPGSLAKAPNANTEN